MVDPETPEESHRRALRELEGKNVQHYSVLLAAWIHTRMERDRTIVALSAAAIGLLVTLLTTTGVPRWWLLVPYATAFIGFAFSIGAALLIYQRNSEKIENDIKGASHPGYRTISLTPYDRAAVLGFFVGAASLIMIGLASATLSYLTARNDMPDPKVERAIAPKPDETRSLQGIEALKPQAPEVPPKTSEQPAPAVQPEPTPPAESD